MKFDKTVGLLLHHFECFSHFHFCGTKNCTFSRLSLHKVSIMD